MVGIDIVEVARIAAAHERFGDKFLRKVFTDEEIRYALTKKNMHQSLAGRFAAKEAFIKAYGRGIAWKEIGIAEREGGKPVVFFRGTRYDGVSISHEKAYAVAIVIIQESGGRTHEGTHP